MRRVISGVRGDAAGAVDIFEVPARRGGVEGRSMVLSKGASLLVLNVERLDNCRAVAKLDLMHVVKECVEIVSSDEVEAA